MVTTSTWSIRSTLTSGVVVLAMGRTVGTVTSVQRTGVHQAALHALFDRIEREVAGGNIAAAQVAIGREGEVVAFRSFGSGTDDSRFVIFSATKALVAMALL